MTDEERGVTAAVLEALVFAGEAHNGQRRKDAPGSPHLKHVLQVTELLAGAGVLDRDLLVSAALHDLLPDTDVDVEQVRARFGAAVADLVEELSSDRQLPRVARQEELPGIVMQFSDGAQLIKLAEKISNLRDLVANPPVGWSRQRRRDYFAWTEEVTSSLRGRNALLDGQLDQALAQRP